MRCLVAFVESHPMQWGYMCPRHLRAMCNASGPTCRSVPSACSSDGDFYAVPLSSTASLCACLLPAVSTFQVTHSCRPSAGSICFATMPVECTACHLPVDCSARHLQQLTKACVLLAALPVTFLLYCLLTALRATCSASQSCMA
jgi:hypothetical protein